MRIQQSFKVIFSQLADSIARLTNEQYSQKIETLSGATIGQHVRHVIEMFVCLQDGYAVGTINYENRKRDISTEISKEKAIHLINEINNSIFQENKSLVLEAGFDENSYDLHSYATNYFREIAYNLEHTIHHMALIKIGIKRVSDIILPENYGVAPSTVKYWRHCEEIHQ